MWSFFLFIKLNETMKNIKWYQDSMQQVLTRHGVACVAGGFVYAGSKGLAVKSREKPLPPHSSRSFAATTFDPARTKPPATQARHGGKHKLCMFCFLHNSQK